MFAVRAGDIRFSISQTDEIAKDGNVQIVLRTDDLEAATRSWVISGGHHQKGVVPHQDILEAPKFM